VPDTHHLSVDRRTARGAVMQIWVNPACSKCAVALDTLAEAGLEPQQRRYLEQPPTVEELRDVLNRLRLEPWDITRLAEPTAVELGMPAWPRERERWIAALAQHPLLIQRPILLLEDGTALVARSHQDLHSAVTSHRG